MIEVVLAGTGAFGADVVDLLAGYGYGGAVAAPSLPGTLAGRPDAAVLVAFRPSPALCARVDDAAAQAAVPWLPVVLENGYVRVGPWIDHRIGPCFRCYYGRRLQHDEQQQVTRALHAGYDRDPDAGPRGHLPQHARLAAAVTGRLLRTAPARSQPHLAAVGSVFAIRLDNGQVSRHHVVAWHGCARCATPVRSDPAPRHDRTVAHVHA